MVAEAYRAVVGLTAAECPDAEAIDRMLNPARNPYRRETLNVGVHAPMMRPLQHANFTFAKKISHTADSQDQRHRMVPGSRPLLTLADTRSPDYITPMLIRDNPRALEIYSTRWKKRGPRKMNCSIAASRREFALYLLPNAKSIRLVESGSLLAPAAQMDDADVLQRAGRNLSIVDRGSGTGARGISGTRALHRPAVLSPRWNFDADLHRRLAFLRRESLARFPQHPATHMTRRGSLIYYLAAWALGCFFMVVVVWCWDLLLVSHKDLVREATEGFLTLIVYGYLFGAPTALLFGFLLRRIMAALKCKNSPALGSRRRHSCAAGDRSAGICEPERCKGSAAGICFAIVSASRVGKYSARRMVAGDSGRRGDGLLLGANSARVRNAAECAPGVSV